MPSEVVIQQNEHLLFFSNLRVATGRFKVALVVPVLKHQVPVFERPPHAKIELVFFERLKDIVVRASPDRFERRREVVHRRDHDDRDVGVSLVQPLDQAEAVHFRHDHVAEDQIHRLLTEVLLSQATVAHRSTLVPLSFEERRDNFPNGFFVVNNKYLCFGQVPPQVTSLYGRTQIRQGLVVD